MEYRLLDTGNCRKLEQAGKYRLIRPALNAFWTPTLKQAEWDQADGVFERNSSGGGNWEWKNKVPDSWLIRWGGFDLTVKPTNFGHLGFFAEQYANWEWFRKVIPMITGEVKTLNLFAYSGVGSMAMAEAGARVTHLDAARGMIEWGRDNQRINACVPDTIRWIADDVQKFVRREIKRGNKYNGIALDPPTFGRGSKGQLWKIEQHLGQLLLDCRKLKDDSKPFFIVLSCHSPGFSPLVLERMVRDVFGNGESYTGEMTVPEGEQRCLPAGNFVRFSQGFKEKVCLLDNI
ncbi:class I SAM-dependent methyltransferase [Lentisphaerota bacterium ZTH]|nr:class I SAM-dependent methyltransferase [Lentisphaerota bacterium]WET07672.1 class I SAM-dependent methyltransferase [Lentisphaerota bacterium ZTH]